MVILQKFLYGKLPRRLRRYQIQGNAKCGIQPYWKPFHLQNNDFDDTHG